MVLQFTTGSCRACASLQQRGLCFLRSVLGWWHRAQKSQQGFMKSQLGDQMKLDSEEAEVVRKTGYKIKAISDKLSLQKAVVNTFLTNRVLHLNRGINVDIATMMQTLNLDALCTFLNRLHRNTKSPQFQAKHPSVLLKEKSGQKLHLCS